MVTETAERFANVGAQPGNGAPAKGGSPAPPGDHPAPLRQRTALGEYETARAGADKPASHGGRPRPELPARTFTPERAPRLRRIAAILDEHADLTSSPANAKALACQMRLRAAELEGAGNLTSFDADEATELLIHGNENR